MKKYRTATSPGSNSLIALPMSGNGPHSPVPAHRLTGCSVLPRGGERDAIGARPPTPRAAFAPKTSPRASAITFTGRRVAPAVAIGRGAGGAAARRPDGRPSVSDGWRASTGTHRPSSFDWYKAERRRSISAHAFPGAGPAGPWGVVPRAVQSSGNGAIGTPWSRSRIPSS